MNATPARTFVTSLDDTAFAALTRAMRVPSAGRDGTGNLRGITADETNMIAAVRTEARRRGI